MVEHANSLGIILLIIGIIFLGYFAYNLSLYTGKEVWIVSWHLLIENIGLILLIAGIYLVKKTTK